MIPRNSRAAHAAAIVSYRNLSRFFEHHACKWTADLFSTAVLLFEGFQRSFVVLMKLIGGKVQFVKFHAVWHLIEDATLFGSLQLGNCAPVESNHRKLKKAAKKESGRAKPQLTAVRTIVRSIDLPISPLFISLLTFVAIYS